MSAQKKQEADLPETTRRRQLIIVGTLLIVFVLVGALALRWNLPRQAGTPATSGPPAPDFSVPTLDGGTFTLTEQGDTPVILFIMAYWCGSCIPEAQALAQLHQTYGDQVTIVALDVDPSSSPEALQAFRARVGNPDYVWAFDEGNRVAEAYNVRALDSTHIINQADQIVYSDAAPTSYERLNAELQQVLQ